MKSQEEVDAAVSLLKASLESRDDKQITGAMFGEMVRKTTPELDIQTLGLPTKATFSRFIEKYFEGVLFRSHAKGKDWVYTIGAQASETDDEPEYALWRTFVRPQSKSKVGLITASKTLILLDAEACPTGVTVISSVTQEELSRILKAFAREEEARLGGAIPDIAQPYASWTASLRERDRVAYRRWIEFRIDGLLQLFNQRLEAADVDEDDRKRLAAFMNRSRSARLLSKTSSKASSTAVRKEAEGRNAIGGLEEPLSASYAASKDADLRDLVIRAVMNLSISELRELRLPVGAVADALGITGKR